MTFDLGVFAEYGREGDDTIAHVSTGERVIPPGVLGKDLSKKIDNKMEAMGLDPDRYIVGSEKNSINPATGQPEFFLGTLLKSGASLAGDLFGSRSDRKALEKLTEDAERTAAAIEALEYSERGIGGPLGGISYDEDGNLVVTPGERPTALAEQFAALGADLAGRTTQDADRVRGLIEDPIYSREELLDMFTSGLPMAERGIISDTDSALSRIYGRQGISSGSAGAMGRAQAQADMARQALRTGAEAGATDAYLRNLTGTSNALAAALGLETGALANLQNLAGAELGALGAPYAALPYSLDYNKNRSLFDIARLTGAANARMGPAELQARMGGSNRGGAFMDFLGNIAGDFFG